MEDASQKIVVHLTCKPGAPEIWRYSTGCHQFVLHGVITITSGSAGKHGGLLAVSKQAK
jgi:hypothetical protein